MYVIETSKTSVISVKLHGVGEAVTGEWTELVIQETVQGVKELIFFNPIPNTFKIIITMVGFKDSFNAEWNTKQWQTKT